MLILDARTATPHFPGIGRYVAHLAHALANLVHPDEFAVLAHPTAHAHQPLPNVPRLEDITSPFSIQQQWRIPAQLRRARATLYHSPYYLMPYLTGVPTVLTVYDVIPLLYPNDYRPMQRLVYRLAHRWALGTARAVLAISASTQRDFIQHFRVAPDKITVTPLAADARFTPCPAAEVEAVRGKLGLPENYVLYFGSNKPHKNLPRLVEAFGKTQIPTSKLVIAGQWDERFPEAKRLVEEHGWAEHIRFIGPVAEANVPALYSGATFFAFPSEYEGFGLPVLEAMACGVPVACANTSSLPEVTGDAAWLFDPTSAEAIGDALTRARADATARAEKRTLGLQRAAQFSWARTAAQTLAIYRALQH